MDEDEVVEYRQGGSMEVLRVGLDAAALNNRSRYLSGEIEVDEFEAEAERLMRKRTSCPF